MNKTDKFGGHGSIYDANQASTITKHGGGTSNYAESKVVRTNATKTPASAMDESSDIKSER